MKHLVLLLLLMSLSGTHADDRRQFEPAWYTTAQDGSVRLVLWFFWSERCPHCLDALPVVKELSEQNPWIRLESRQLINNLENQQQYLQYAQHLGEEARSVPAFFFCNTMLVGFDLEANTGNQILQEMKSCRSELESSKLLPQQQENGSILRKEIGDDIHISLDGMSLPVITVIIAGLDAFNPCAFFILLFLLSLMVNLKSRKRMFLIGGVFVLFSGLVYYLFMAAWLNIFLLFGAIQWVTLLAGLVAIAVAVFNIRDYFIASEISLSLSDRARSGLFQRMRALMNSENTGLMVVSAIVLAIVANSYELLCTSGLPMVYTRLLTMEDLPVSDYYAYLLVYNLIYVLPLFLIVILFALTLGSRKLREYEGRTLKLLSGSMMMGLGLLLVFFPDKLHEIVFTTAVILVSILIALAGYIHERRKQ